MTDTRAQKLDPEKTKLAKQVEKILGRKKEAGMMVTNLPSDEISSQNSSMYSFDSYQSSYSDGFNQVTTRDIPRYFAAMNEQNGGLIYWPVQLVEKYEWYRYFAATDAYVSRGLELLVDLPISKITLRMPKVKGLNKKKTEDIKLFYEDQVQHLELYDALHSILHEWYVIGNVFPFHEWDSKKKRWDKIVVMPPEEMKSFTKPFSSDKIIEYRPPMLLDLIRQGLDGTIQDETQQSMYDEFPDQVKKQVEENNAVRFDTDPSTGSFVHHLARKKAAYMDMGVSIIERILVPLLQKEHYKYTQLSLASRNMTPKNLISAEGINADQLDMLRSEIDMSYLDPDYAIVVNFPVQWELIGADNRLLDLTSEYERIESQVFAALGVTRELLTGEGVYSGTKITTEILNTMFMKARDMLVSYIENKLFKPIAEAHGWFTENKDVNVKEYWYPKVGFNRLTIRDNAEVFDNLFTLYQKGSLPIDVIYELFNLDTENLHEKIKNDLFTVKDPVFNRMVEEVSSGVGDKIIEGTNISDSIIKYLGLTKVEPPADGGGDDWG